MESTVKGVHLATRSAGAEQFVGLIVRLEALPNAGAKRATSATGRVIRAAPDSGL
jgi:hypothetical protein